MGAILCGLLSAFGIGAWTPENWRASAELRVVRARVPECGETAADVEFGHLSSICEVLEPSKFKDVFASGTPHLRRRVVPDRLYFEVEGPDRVEVERESDRWALAAAQRLARLQNQRLSVIPDERTRLCVHSAMLRLDDSNLPPNVEALHFSRWRLGLGGGAFFWLLRLLFLIGGSSGNRRRERSHAD